MMDFDKNDFYLFGRISMIDCLEGSQILDAGPFIGLITGKFNCLGCVLNTDISSGRGKHWVAVFIDCRDDNEWTIEYFNSAGNPPPTTMINWMEKTRKQLTDYANKLTDSSSSNKPINVETVCVTDIEHQQSETECGMYSLFYIRARLDGKSYKWFTQTVIPDADMIEFRKHLFRKHS
jgi:hypothetical protein